MVAILEKSEHNVDFHPMVDFIEASPLRYALTVKPTVYVSHIRQFWSTARIETTEEGTKILATVDDSPFDLVAYSDSDYGGATQDRKSTTGGCQFLGRRLISWKCKNQTIVATSTTEAEYVAAASCYGKVLWIQNQLLDYRDCFEKKLINVDHIHTDENIADLLTKPFDAGRFQLSMPCETLSREISTSILR
nr:putative ribonuclease H-like domain-containing protein [Tanacetum cinerariifolium]